MNALRIKDMRCCAPDCQSNAESRREPGPLCNLHYQRWITRGTLSSAPKQLARTWFHCAECGVIFERAYPMARDRKNGSQYCSSTCLTAKRKRKAEENAASRFWAKVDRRGGNECWEWKGYRALLGYGRVKFRAGETQMSHRIAYLLANGEHPESMFVCHRCDNPPCCNPNHLFLGTHLDNMKDMAAKGRSGSNGVIGENHAKARFTAETALEVYRSLEPNKVLAERFGVTAAAVYNIRHGRAWAHVTGAARG